MTDNKPLSKEEIFGKYWMGKGDVYSNCRDLAEKAMDEYAKREAIEFCEFIANALMVSHYDWKELYEEYKKEKSK